MFIIQWKAMVYSCHDPYSDEYIEQTDISFPIFWKVSAETAELLQHSIWDK